MIRNVSSVHINERNALKMHVVEEDMPIKQYRKEQMKDTALV
ncbi:hypothetical protein [uncultured Helicobacter sp.]|nr:hypothetical protein [uncultured Helicobacter sp.]